MIYMNAANALEPAAECNLSDLLALDTNEDVNIIVELSYKGAAKINPDGRTTSLPCGSNPVDKVKVPYWTGTQRFVVRNHERYKPEIPIATDLTNSDALDEFLSSARSCLAEHYMLDLWGHSEDFHTLDMFLLTNYLSLDYIAHGFPIEADRLAGQPAKHRSPILEALHLLTDSSNTAMYRVNGEERLSIEQIVSSIQRRFYDRKLEVVGFDTCAKANIEVAYSLSKVALFMIASQETEPSNGWDYGDWLARLIRRPSIDGRDLSRIIVGSYRRKYENHRNNRTTLSAIDLPKLPSSAQAVNALADYLLHYSAAWPRIYRARCRLFTYARNNIDLIQFLYLFRKSSTKTSKEYKLVTNAIERIRASVLQGAYASISSRMNYGSYGLSIYFPNSTTEDRDDPDHAAYDPCSPFFSAFGHDNQWRLFLKTYLASVSYSTAADLLRYFTDCIDH